MVQTKQYSRRKFLALLASSGAVGAGALMKPQHALAAENTRETIVFVDDLGRSVRVPKVVNNVTPTGISAQTMLCELCPEKIASLAVEISSADAVDYWDADMGEITELIETGTLLSTSDTDIDSDEIADISPTVMIDVGLPKEGLIDKLNALQLETGIPYVFIDISFGNLPKAYRTLGLLLGCIDRAGTLASYVEAVMSEVKDIASKQTTASKVFYAQRERGLMVTGGLSLQLDAISYAGGIPVTEPYDYISKTVSLDTLADTGVNWILFDDTDVLEPMLQGNGEVWDIWADTITSCGAGFAVSPALYHSWLGSMVFVQSIGLLWLASVMWTESCGYSMEERAQEFNKLFYGLDVADETAQELVGDFSEKAVGDIPAPELFEDSSEEVLDNE